MSASGIAQVTAALRGLLKAKLPGTVTVSLLQPSDTLLNPSVNLYLYRVAENPQLRNAGWRGDRASPPTKAPALALDLFYLLTPFADPPQDADTLSGTHTLLGSAMQVFHDNAVVNDVHTSSFDFDEFAGIDDLRKSFDKVIVRHQPTTTEELSKIWMMFNQPYRLSVAYQVSLLQIAPLAPAPAPAAPVMVTVLDVFPSEPPRLAELTPARGGTGRSIALRGFRLSRKSFRSGTTFGGRSVVPTTIDDRKLDVTVPIDLEAGPEQEVRAVLDGRESNPLTYVVSPWLRRLQPLRAAPAAAPAPPAPVILEVTGVDLAAAATVTVEFGGTAIAHLVLDSSQLRIAVPTGLPNGSYPVRVTVDGEASNERRFEIAPLLTQLVPSTPLAGAALRIDGERLDGTKLRVDFDPGVVMPDANTNAARLNLPRVPRLDPGRHELRVTVDGRESNALPFTVP
jgi:uncharacterized protein DUF4255/IPT/TIG domain-containing protein